MGIYKRCHISEWYLIVWSTSIPGIQSFFFALHPPKCFMILSSRLSVKCQYMPSHFLPLSFTSLPDTKTHLSVCLYPCTRNFLSFAFSHLKGAQKSTKLPAPSTGRCITSVVIPPCCRGTQTQRRDRWLMHWQVHGWHDKWQVTVWHPSLMPNDDSTSWTITGSHILSLHAMTHTQIYIF